MTRVRKPAFRTKQPRLYMKPFSFLHKKIKIFNGYSRRKKITIIGGGLAAFLIFTPILSYLYFIRDINDAERLMNRNSTGIVITDRNGEVVYSNGRTSNKKLYKLDEISDHMEQALLASEDKKFYEHDGFSFKSMIGALAANVLNRDLTKYGGSTLTQQLVKNNLLTDSKNFIRKYQEVSLAVAIENSYSKDEILEMYMNSVYYGEGAFGIEEAARTYFNKSPKELTLAESSVLVGLLPAPSTYSPINGNPELSKREQERVLGEMVTAKYISEQEKAVALETELAYAEGLVDEQEYGHHFTQYVINELKERYGEERTARSGFTVKTTLDLSAQKKAEQTVKERVNALSRLGATNAATVAINPRNGEVLALVGSTDWKNEQFGQVNMADTPRQPGSSFKPIFFAEALDKKLVTPSTIIHDEKKSYGDYSPENYDFRYRGDITIRYALAQSLNIPAIEVIEKLGVGNAAKAAQRMGIDTVDNPDSYGLTLALGTAETSLIDMTNAYAAFANGGLQHIPSVLLSIEDKYKNTIFTYKPNSKRVQSAEASYLVSSILSDEKARAPLSGSSLNISGSNAAVKTGTTNDNVDAWTIGYTPNIAVGVWVGDNQHKPMQVGGGSGAGPIWRTTMKSFLGDSPDESFQRPSNIVRQELCSVNGNYFEFYIKGTQPSKKCKIPSQAEIDAKKREAEEAEERRKREEEERNKQQEQEQQIEEEPILENNDNTNNEEVPEETEPTTPATPTSPLP